MPYLPLVYPTLLVELLRRIVERLAVVIFIVVRSTKELLVYFRLRIGFAMFVASVGSLSFTAFAGLSQGWVYWVELDSDSIKRAHLNGSDVQILYSSLDGVSNPAGLALHAEMDHVHWTDAKEGIWQGNLDGTQVPLPLVQEQGAYSQLVIDPVNGKMYWIEGLSSSNKILKANLDGSQVEEIPLGNVPSTLALDVDAGKLYWGLSDQLGCNSAKIQRASLDGDGIEDVVTGLKLVIAIAVDHDAVKIYWSENPNCGVNAIKRRDLAGGPVETLVPEAARGIALDLVAAKMYWTRTTGVDAIRRSNLDGTCAQDVVAVGLQFPLAIALIPEANPADLNDDGLVSGIDLAILLGTWGRCSKSGCGCDADLNHNGVVNGIDLAILLGAWST